MSSEVAIAKLKKLKLKYDNVVELKKPIGNAGWKLKATPSFDEKTTVEVLGKDVDLSVQASASALVHPADHTIDPFGDGDGFTAPANHSFAELHLKAGLGADTKFSVPSAPLKVEVRASAGAEVQYHYLVPVAHTTSRINALKATVHRAEPSPRLLKLKRIAQRGEIHVYDAWINLDLGIGVRYGADFNLNRVVKLFDALPSTTIKAHVALTAKAGMGWSMYRKTRVVVARSRGNPKWLRARIEKKKRQKLSLNASLDLKATYDLAKPFEAILDHALELDPVVDVVEALEKVASFKGDGRWKKIEQRLNNRLGEELAGLVEDSGWREWAASSAQAKELVSFSDRLVKSWSGFDATYQERIRTVWNELLGATDLGPKDGLRGAIETISTIDPNNLVINELLNEESAEIVDLIENLTGTTIENLLLGDSAGREIARAVKAAKQVLGALENAPQSLFDKFEKLQEKSGINKTVAFLKKNATSKDKLERAIEKQINPRLKRLAEKLTDKIWSQIDDDDIKKVKAWAARVHGALDRKDEWETDARRRIAKLRGDAGFSISLEFERLTETNAVLDLEFNPSNADVRDAVEEGLERGNVRALLSRLPDQDDDERDADDPDWLIREGIFSSRKRRSGSIAILSSLSGTGRKTSERTHEVDIRIKGRRRNATYSAGFTRRFERPDLPAFEASTWWVADATGPGVDLDRKYDVVGDEMRLQFQRFDTRLVPAEITAMDALMTGFGFAVGEQHPIESAVRAALQVESLPNLDARLTLTLRLPQHAVDTFLLPEQDEWDRHLLNASHRWYTEALVDRPSQENSSVQLGNLIAALLRHDRFQANWRKGFIRFGNAIKNQRIPVGIANTTLPVTLMRKSGATWRFETQYQSLGRLVRARVKSWNKLDDAFHAHKTGIESREPKGLENAAQQMARAFKASRGSKSWGNPAFLPWLVLAGAAGSGGMLGAKGVASFRWRRFDTTGAYKVHVWELERGVPDLTPLFPFKP